MHYDVALVSCGSQKAAAASAARNLYTSGSFRSRLRLAELAAPRVLVLSALHGLLELGAVVDPYDFKITDHDASTLTRWRSRVLGQAGELGGRGTRCLVLGSRGYLGAVEPVLALEPLCWVVTSPLVGLSQGRSAQVVRHMIGVLTAGQK